MGCPSATQMQNWTDRLAAVLAKDLTGFDAELASAANTSLSDQVDGSGDLALEAALMPASLGVDRQSLPENYAAALRVLTGRAPLQAWVSALNSHLLSADGGSYANLQAYLTDKSPTLHPLAAELFRNVLGETAFTVASLVPNVFAPNYQSRAPDRLYTGADGSLVDDTTDALDVGTADVPLFAANGDAVYVGSRYKFNRLVMGLSTKASATVTPTFQYWNGNGWVAVPVLTDNTTGFQRNDVVSFTPPADWARCYKDAGGTVFPGEKTPLYYLRIVRGNAAGITAPTASVVRIAPLPVYQSGVLHLGVDQPPLGLARITGVNTISVESLVGVDITRFAAAALRLRALTPFAVNLTPTVSYVNQAGADQTQAQSAWTAPAALDSAAVTLNGADTGARSVRTTGWAVTTAATDGVFEVYAPESRTPAL